VPPPPFPLFNYRRKDHTFILLVISARLLDLLIRAKQGQAGVAADEHASGRFGVGFIQTVRSGNFRSLFGHVRFGRGGERLLGPGVLCFFFFFFFLGLQQRGPEHSRFLFLDSKQYRSGACYYVC